MAEPLAINIHSSDESSARPTKAGMPLNPALSRASVRPTAINLPILLQLNIATNCASGNTMTINPAISFMGSIINCGRSAWRRIFPVAIP
ncbi:hypothetical protein D3C80_1904530 [compost metagenome]